MQTKLPTPAIVAFVAAATHVVAPSRAANGTAAEAAADLDCAKLKGVVRTSKLADALPASVKSSGVLAVATDLTPPITFHGGDGGTTRRPS